jgi:PAS domain S-box-containing protein
MSPLIEPATFGGYSGRSDILDEPEQASLLRLTKLVEHVFRVPVAYMALLGSDPSVTARIGSGSAYWQYLRTYPLDAILAEPQLWRYSDEAPIAGFVHGDLRFAASVPLRSSDGLELGLLVIADVRDRPDFSQRDHEILFELAEVLSGKMELRMMASKAHESEVSMTESEYRFRNIANSAPVMIFYSAVDGGCAFVNQAWLGFTGRSLQEELGVGIEDMFHPDYREAVLRTYWDAFNERAPLMVQFPMRRQDGKYRWMELRGVPRFKANGVFTGYIGCCVDVTDQRAAILDFQKQVLCTKAVAEAVGASYLILDPEGRIEQVSPDSPPDIRGRFIWDGYDAAVTASAAIRDAIHRTASSREAVRIRTAYSRAGADPVELSWTFTPILSPGDELIALVATATVLTNRSPVSERSFP